MNGNKLGRIEIMRLRDVFKKEDKDFTPWLNENLNTLGNKLDLDIIDSNIEEVVGSFNCDIIAKDSNSKKTVIIENQFGTTDHDHLGKILTYSAVKKASIIIWIAENFREEHTKTLDWLNESVSSESELSFFGVEIKLIKIHDSPPAPDFRIIVKPNDWERSIKLYSQPMSISEKNYLQFYTKLANTYSSKNSKWRKAKPRPQSWLGFSSGKSGLQFVWAFRSGNRFSVELYIDTGDKNENERIFEELYNHRVKIEKLVKGLNWEKLVERKACRIGVYKGIKAPIRHLTETDYPSILKWATETMTQFYSVFSRYIKKL